jgi:hypothetical protein
MPDKDTWNGGPTNYKENKTLTLKDIDTWLNKKG